MKTYKLRCKNTHKFIAEDNKIVVRNKTSGRNWKNPSAPITMVSFFIEKALRAVYDSDGSKAYEDEIKQYNLIPLELLTIEDGNIISVEDVDYEALKKKVLRKLVYRWINCHQVYFDDYMSKKIKDDHYYCHAIVKDVGHSAARHTQLVRNEISELGLSRVIKAKVTIGYEYNRYGTVVIVTYRADFRFANKDAQMLWRLGNDKITLDDFYKADPSVLNADIEKLNRLFDLAL